MKVGDLVIDPSGFHKGIGIIRKAYQRDDGLRLWVVWLHGEHPYSTGCRYSDVEVVNESG